MAPFGMRQQSDRTGREQFARFAIAQFTRDGYDEELAAEMLERIPMATLEAMLETGKRVEYDLEALLRPLNMPLLFAQHKDCLLFTDEGYADAVAAFPEARTCSMEKVCAVNPIFADALREFCATSTLSARPECVLVSRGKEASPRRCR